jgi:hypothetical protein
MNRDLLLWMGILTGPIIWFINLETGFALAPWLCPWHSKFSPNLVSLIALLIVAGSGMIGWRQWNQIQTRSAGEGAPEARPRAMAIGGMVLSGMFFLAIVAQALPQLLLDGCQ